MSKLFYSVISYYNYYYTYSVIILSLISYFNCVLSFDGKSFSIQIKLRGLTHQSLAYSVDVLALTIIRA